MMFKPKSWNKARRYVIKRTPIVDKDDQQLYLDDGLRQYVYWIVVSNSKRSNEQVLRIARVATRRTSSRTCAAKAGAFSGG